MKSHAFPFLCLVAVAFSLLSGAAVAQGSWQRFPLLEKRTGASLAFDITRGQTVMFGGRNLEGFLGDTWEWDGSAWSPVASTGPTARTGHAMVYDSARRVTVLFGGTGANGVMHDTWQWDGISWLQIAAGGPAARLGHAMAYDSSRGRTVLFGGTSPISPNQYLDRDDTWEWDGAAWTQVASGGPTARSDHAMAFDSARNLTVMFGRKGLYGADTWEWNGTTWTQATWGGLGPLHGANSMTYDSSRNRIVMTDGYGVLYWIHISQLWEWDGLTWTRVSQHIPTYHPALAFDSARNEVVGFGGLQKYAQSYNIFYPENSTFLWDGNALTRASAPPPIERSFHAMAYDSLRGKAVLFGGTHSGYNSIFSDGWEWNGVTWSSLTVIPPYLANPSMVYDSLRDKIVMFGTNTNSRTTSETWEWDGLAWTQATAVGPPARRRHSMSYDSTRGKTVIYGGYFQDSSALLNDTWEWDGASWSQVAWGGPPMRASAAMAYDSRRNKTVLFGGSSGTMPPLNDTWEWDGNAWTQAATSGPTPRHDHALAFHHARGKTILFGGQSSNGRLNDTWEWDGTTWQSVTSSSPSARYGHAMVYDTTHRRVLLFGGNAILHSRQLDQYDTWEWLAAGIAQNYGAGCGSPALQLHGNASAPPVINGTAQVSLTHIPSTVAFVAMGWSRTALFGLPLPLSLGSYGLPGCELLQSAEHAALPVSFAGAGTATYSLALPNWPGLVGINLYLQAWALAPAANPGNTIVSNGVEWLVGY